MTGRGRGLVVRVIVTAGEVPEELVAVKLGVKVPD